jgi:hypothetical protein
MNNAAGLRPDGNANLEGLNLDGMGSAPDRSKQCIYVFVCGGGGGGGGGGLCIIYIHTYVYTYII